MTEHKLPVIPKIEDEGLKNAVSALCRAAGIFHRCFVSTCEGSDPEDLLAEHRELLLECEAVLDAWRDHLGHTVEDLLEEA
jgi:hypothetical protein